LGKPGGRVGFGKPNPKSKPSEGDPIEKKKGRTDSGRGKTNPTESLGFGLGGSSKGCKKKKKTHPVRYRRKRKRAYTGCTDEG